MKKEKNYVKGNLPERKYGKPLHPYSKRVGSHAEMMKKHYKINVPVNASDKITHTKGTNSRQGKPGVTMKSTIDLTNVNNTQQSSCDAMWIPCLGLRKEDEKILQSSRAWLNDSLINSTHNLLRRQFPNIKGLANSQYVAAKKSPQCSLTSDCIQIHQSEHSHWVVSSVSNGKITVYDSMLPNITLQLSCQLLHLYGDKEDVHKPIRVTVTMCQQQMGESDCGLFAISSYRWLVWTQNHVLSTWTPCIVHVIIMHCSRDQHVTLAREQCVYCSRDNPSVSCIVHVMSTWCHVLFT